MKICPVDVVYNEFYNSINFDFFFAFLLIFFFAVFFGRRNKICMPSVLCTSAFLFWAAFCVHITYTIWWHFVGKHFCFLAIVFGDTTLANRLMYDFADFMASAVRVRRCPFAVCLFSARCCCFFNNVHSIDPSRCWRFQLKHKCCPKYKTRQANTRLVHTVV